MENINNVIGNKDNIIQIRKWLCGFPTKHKTLIISGNHGIGKKLIISLLDTL